MLRQAEPPRCWSRRKRRNQGGSLSHHRRYKRRLASSPEEGPLPACMGVMMGSTKAAGVFDSSDQSLLSRLYSSFGLFFFFTSKDIIFYREKALKMMLSWIIINKRWQLHPFLLHHFMNSPDLGHMEALRTPQIAVSPRDSECCRLPHTSASPSKGVEAKADGLHWWKRIHEPAADRCSDSTCEHGWSSLSSWGSLWPFLVD